MAEKRVSELNSASSINLSDLFLLAQDLGQGEYDSLNLSASLLATWLASQVEFPLLLTYTTAKDIIGAINEIASNGGGGAVFLHTQLGTTTIDEDADDVYDAYTNEKLLCLSVLANGQYLLFACTKQTDYTIGDGVTLEFEGEVEGYKWLYVIQVDATNDTVTLERTTTELPTIEDIQELHDEIVSMLPTESASGAVASFETPLTLPLVSHNVTIEPVQSGTGDPSPSNVRPISGWSAVNVTRAGRNLFNKNTIVSGKRLTNTDEVQIHSSYGYSDYIEIKSEISYYFSHIVGANGWYSIIIYDKEKNCLGSTNVSGGADASGSKVFAQDGYVRINFFLVNVDDIQIELGTTATTYEPYNTTTYNIDWTTEAGTVYGGELDVTNGVLRVTYQNIASYAGETINEPWISSMDVYSSGTTPTTGAQVVYPLATPVEITLTPEEINTLKGVNNIWADTGDTAVEYKQDIQTYIDSRLSSGTRSLSLAKAPVETKEETKQEEQEEKEETKTEEEVENDAER